EGERAGPPAVLDLAQVPLVHRGLGCELAQRDVLLLAESAHRLAERLTGHGIILADLGVLATAAQQLANTYLEGRVAATLGQRSTRCAPASPDGQHSLLSVKSSTPQAHP